MDSVGQNTVNSQLMGKVKLAENQPKRRVRFELPNSGEIVYARPDPQLLRIDSGYASCSDEPVALPSPASRWAQQRTQTDVLPGLKMPNGDTFQIVAHRGAQTLWERELMAPQNTMPAFLEAAKRNAAIELDVIATKDGRLAVHHDMRTGKIFKLGSRTRELMRTDWKDLIRAKLNVHGNEKSVNRLLGLKPDEKSAFRTPERFKDVNIPLLPEVIKALPNTHFFVELKTTDKAVEQNKTNALEQKIVRLIQQENLYKRVTVISFSPKSVKKVKALDPKIQTGLDLELPRAVKLNTGLQNCYLKNQRKLAGNIQSLHVPYEDVSASLVESAHQQGLKIMPWVNMQTRAEEKADFARLIGLNVDGLISNSIDALKTVVEEHSKTSGL